MPTFSNPDGLYRGTTGTLVPATWTDVVNDDLNALYGDTTWTALTLGTNIVANGAGWRTPSFMGSGKFVTFNGLLLTTGAIASGATIATLPAGYRPTFNVMSMFWNHTTMAPGEARIGTTGLVTVTSSLASGASFTLDCFGPFATI